ncbi:hypothetical protein SAMN05421684_3397 [Asanoa ishikariensis]|uniref:Right handed beta helix region n=1 Tax=Asanoa ishikariensis TaxID=137265 RepID=A0A1H3R270_9ACTN|nr:hypothetical protein SAMN05421684_3397 [Asanoa ishikariensis]
MFSAARKGTRRAPHTTGRRFGFRRPGRALVVALTTLALGAAGVGVAVAKSGSVTVTKAGTVIDGQTINGYVYVKADNVTIRNTTIRYGGYHSLRVYEGFNGTRIEDTKIFCESSKTNGIVFGNYTATRVTLTGCRNGFMFSDAAPATIVDSTWNGQKVNVEAGEALPSAPINPAPTATPTPTAVPTPTATPTVKPSPKPTKPADPPPAAGGGQGPGIPSSFPGPDNTGVPDGTTLKASGGLNLAKAGQVVSGLDIKGCVTVTAKNVTIRNSKISCGSNYSIKVSDASANLLVENVTIDGQGKNSATVCCGGYTLKKVEIFNTIDGPRLSDNSQVIDSWIHHLTRASGSHNDAMQTTAGKNIVVRHNTIEAYNPNTKDPFNACLMIGSTTGPSVTNLVFEQNFCNGGNYSIGVREDLNGSGIVFRDNLFGRDFRYGVIARPTQTGISWQNSTNLFADNRKPVK